MNNAERHKLFRQIMWDYDISAVEVDEVLKGRRDMAGHYDKQAIFIKLLESFSWFTIVQLFSPGELRQLLTQDVIKRLRFKSLRTKYEFVQKRLQTLVPVSENDFQKHILFIKNEIQKEYKTDISKTIVTDEFARFFIEDNEILMKVEFVNDVAYRAGVPLKSNQGNIDTVTNILANKLTAVVGRDEPKNVFDIVTIAAHFSFNWKEIFNHSKEKALLNEIDIEQRLFAFPVSSISAVDWLIKPVETGFFKQQLQKIADDFMLGKENSLGTGKPKIEDALLR